MNGEAQNRALLQRCKIADPAFSERDPHIKHVNGYREWDNLDSLFTTMGPNPLAMSDEVVGKGQTGSALKGSLRVSCFLTEGLFGESRESTFIFPKVSVFPQSVRSHCFCSGPTSVDPNCSQPYYYYYCYYYYYY